MPRTTDIVVSISLQQALNTLTVEDLKKLHNFLPVQQKLTRKAEFVDAIAQQMRGQNLKKIWTQLDDLQKAAVAEAVHGVDDFYQPDFFVAKYGQPPNWGESSFYEWRREPSILCLFFYSHQFSYLMPKDLKQELLRFVPKPKPPELQQLSDTLPSNFILLAETYNFSVSNRTSRTTITEFEIPLTVVEMERSASKDLEAVLRLIQVGKVAVSDKTSLPSTATLKVIADVLQGGDFYNDVKRKADFKEVELPEVGGIKAFGWTLLVQVSGLVELTGKKLALSKTGQKALQESPTKVLQAIWKKWLKTTAFDELRRIDAIKGLNGKGAYGITAVAARRAKITTVLKDCPVGKWIQFSEFSRYMLATGNGFEVTRNPDNLSIPNFSYSDLSQNDSDCWKMLQERYMRCLLFEYAATLGIVDVAYGDPSKVPYDFGYFKGRTKGNVQFLSRYDGLIAFRLTPLGAYCLGLIDKYTPPKIEFRPTLQVLPNLEIVVVGERIDASDAIVLNLYAQKVSDVVWRLDRQKLFTAIEDGYQLAELKQLLERRSSESLPETVQQFLKDVAERSEGLEDRGTARLIECSNAHLAMLIANDSRTKKYCQLAGDRTLVVLTDHESKFRNALKQMGYVLPLVR